MVAVARYNTYSLQERLEAPKIIFNNIFCRSSIGCGGRCGCRKAGFQCSLVCGTFTNGAPVDDLFDDYEYPDDRGDFIFNNNMIINNQIPTYFYYYV